MKLLSVMLSVSMVLGAVQSFAQDADEAHAAVARPATHAPAARPAERGRVERPAERGRVEHPVEHGRVEHGRVEHGRVEHGRVEHGRVGRWDARGGWAHHANWREGWRYNSVWYPLWWSPYWSSYRWPFYTVATYPWLAGIPVNYWQCTAYKANGLTAQPFSAIGPNLEEARFEALTVCNGTYTGTGGVCYIPGNQCFLRN